MVWTGIALVLDDRRVRAHILAGDAGLRRLRGGALRAPPAAGAPIPDERRLTIGTVTLLPAWLF